MKFLRSLSIVTLGCLAFAGASIAANDGVHWTYEGEHGPESWGDLSPDFVQCKVGVNQSPIDITGTVESDLPPLVLDYTKNTKSLINNGHTAQVNVEPGNFLRVEGEVFELKQFHIHVPSEHWIDGKQSMLEVHYVHSNKKGQLAVVAVLHNKGSDSPRLNQHIDAIPTKVGMIVPLVISLKDLSSLALSKDYYRYNGSLTTPPCSEGVRWYVLKEQNTISQARRDRFNQLIGDDARGPQPVNARPVLR